MFIKDSSKRSKPIITLKSFSKKMRKNLILFLKNLVINAETNSWDEINFLKIIGKFLKDDARK